jgi:hypothetical protein
MMGMRGTGVMVFSIILLLCGCLIMGCSSLPSTGTPPAPVGFSSGNITSPAPDSANFAFALSDINEIEYAGTGDATSGNTTEPGILYIRGDQVDATGNASSWLFVVRTTNRTSFVTYSHNGRSVTGWNAGFDGTIVPAGKLVPVEQLFEQNSASLSGGLPSDSNTTWDIVMENTTYMLTSHSTGMIRTFNATSGGQISSYDA